MQVLYPRCCALDVHKLTVVACLRIAEDSKVTTEVRTFDTTTASLIGLRDWLAANKCTHVAMEATGVYWKPAWHILADGEFGWCWRTPRMSRMCRAARPTTATPNGPPTCWRTVSYRLRLIDSDRFRIPKPTRSG